ncbi:MAG: dihydropyrimidinase [Opitutales bacterium]
MEPAVPTVLIRGGTLVHPESTQRADLLCVGEKIQAIGENFDAPEEATVIDASGCFVLPGLVDPHVHAWLPTADVCGKSDYATMGRAAAVGGTTTFLDMCGPTRQQLPREGFDAWLEKAEGQCCCDWSVHLTVSRFDVDAQRQIREIVAEGVTSFKVYLAYPGVLALEDGELFDALGLACELGVRVCAHCEDPVLIERMQRTLLAAGKTSPRWHAPSRPPLVEALGVRKLGLMAHLQNASLYLVHVSSAEALRAALELREAGVDLAVECLVNHLLLDESLTQSDELEAAKYIMSPPLRPKADQDTLWQALQAGQVQTIGTDDAAFNFSGQKDRGRDDFTRIPSGIPSVEHRLDLLHTHGVLAGRIDWPRLVRLTSTEPARLFGLYPQKGYLAEGSDADVVVYDPNLTHTLSVKTHHMPVDYSAYEGWTVRGHARHVLRRGEFLVRGGAFVGHPTGRFLRRPYP